MQKEENKKENKIIKFGRKFVALATIFIFINICNVFIVYLLSGSYYFSLIAEEEIKYGDSAILLFALKFYIYILILFIVFELSSIFLDYYFKVKNKMGICGTFFFFVIIELVLLLVVDYHSKLTNNWFFTFFIIFSPMLLLTAIWALRELIPSNKKRILMLLVLILNIYFWIDKIISEIN